MSRVALQQALLCALLWCFVQGLYQECGGEGGQGQFTACQPDIEKLIPSGNFTLTLDPNNITCGSPRSTYRRLGDRTSFLDKICDASSSDPALNHSRFYMTDTAGQVTWWQSVTMATAGATKPLHVNITLSFNKRYTLMGDLTLTFNSGRPEVMVLEKSVDYGVTWSPLQYYARSCGEVYPQGADYRVTAETMTAVICDNTTAEITSLPRPGGKVVFPVFDQRLRLLLGPTEADFSRYYTSLDTNDVTEFLTFTDLRLRLLEPATDWGTNFNMYYYAISDIEVLARCECNLHASRCIADVTGQTVCECSHNTAGRDCEMCLPLYNERPWQKGKYSPFDVGTANQCQKCECNEHAVACVYDPQYGRGVCQNCQHNTTGRHCEGCMPGFFPNDTLAVNDSSRCADCDCEPLGTVEGSTVCSQVAGLVMPLVGQCDCRPLVTGRRCDRCVPGYYGLLLATPPGGCRPCGCHPDGSVAGSVCAESDGQCTCKLSTSGRSCDTCADGYYDFPKGQPSRGCLPCACDAGGAVSALCNVTEGTCNCRQHMDGLKCDQVEAGYYVPALDVTYQPSTGCVVTKDLWRSDRPFDGGVFASCDVTSDVIVQFQPVVDELRQLELVWSYQPALRYTLVANESDATLNGTLTLTVNGNSGANVTSYGQVDSSCPHKLSESQTFDVTLTAGLSVAWLSNITASIDVRCRYGITLSISRKTSLTAPVQVDSFVLVPSLTSSSTNRTLGVHDSASQEAYKRCVTQLAALLTRDSALTSDTCRGVFRSVAAQLFNGAQACGCDPVGTEAGTRLCNEVGGQCHCKPGVAGRACDQCLPGFFNFSSTGCTACDCDLDGSSHGACDFTSGQCACLQNVARAEDVGTSGVTGDRKCSQCRQNFYGHVTSVGCLPCNCHVNGSNGSQCDVTGQCPCVSSVQGLQCNICRPGYFAFGASGCRPCGCDIRGSLDVTCDQGLGTCNCKEHVTGAHCDVCKPGYFNLAAVNSRGCQPCFCFQHGSSCNSATGFVAGSVTSDSTETWTATNDHYEAPPHFQGDHHVSYGQLLSFHLTTPLPLPDLHNMTWVLLQGDQEQGPIRLSHVATNVTSSTPTNSMLAVRLHATNWRRDDGSTPTEMDMLRVLADLNSLLLPRQLAGATVTYSDIVMETAVAGSGGNVSTYVENCTCSSVSSVSGLSCENCAPGTRRVNTNLTSHYQVCTACNCSGRALTTPPLCDQWTGVCLNCRNGTEGGSCQLCAPHVQGVECNVCEDEYWGLGRYGCQACNCSQPGATSRVCDKVTGQCACAQFVTGRRCESCQENYHSLTATGCQECDACYKLVMLEVTSLRALMGNITSSVLLLENNDRTRDLGDFVPRLNSAISTSQQLLAFLSDTTQAEDNFKDQLAALTSQTLQLGDTVRRLADNTTSEIEAVLSETSRQFQSATLASQSTKDNVYSAYSQNAPLISSTVPSLQSMAASLQTVESDLQVRADNSNTARLAALSELQDLEQVVNETNARAQSRLQTVQLALVAHQNNSRSLTNLEGVDVTLNVLTADTLTEARQVRTKSEDVIQSADRLQSTISTIGQPAIDTAGMKQSLADVTSRADTLQTQAVQASFDFTSTETQVGTVTVGTETLRTRVQTLVNDVSGMTTRVMTADQRARAAQQESGLVFQAADTMLQTMQNFEARAREVELKTNTSLAAVEIMRQNSAAVRAEAAAVTSSLVVAQLAASQAIDISRQAKTIGDVQFNRLSPVAVSAQTLQNTTTDLDGVTVSAQRPQALLTSNVRPANLTCSQHQQLIATVKSQVEITASLTMNVTNRVAMAANRANTLLSNLRNLPSVDLDRILTLLTEVNSVRAQFNTAELTSAITAVQASSAAHTLRIAQLTARKAELQAKVKQLQAIQQQLIP